MYYDGAEWPHHVSQIEPLGYSVGGSYLGAAGEGLCVRGGGFAAVAQSRLAPMGRGRMARRGTLPAIGGDEFGAAGAPAPRKVEHRRIDGYTTGPPPGNRPPLPPHPPRAQPLFVRSRSFQPIGRAVKLLSEILVAARGRWPPWARSLCVVES